MAPQLAAVVQPLAGEWAAHRSPMVASPVPSAHGVELSTLLDTCLAHGLTAIAQVDLGSRAHHHQGVHDLAVMAAELLVVVDRRRPRGAGVPAAQEPPAATLWHFVRDGAAAPAGG